MRIFLVKTIRLVHIIIILLMFVLPFTNSNYLLTNHLIYGIFILIHWILNNDTCFLTKLELYLRNNNEDECFTCKIINPIYKFTDNQYKIIIYMTTIFLLSMSFIKLYNKYETGIITSKYDLLKF